MTAQYLFSSAKRNAALAAIGGDAIGQIEVDLLKQVLVATVASGGGGGGGAAAWGSITGTLSAQTDLQTALDAKLNLTGGTVTGQLILQNASATGAVNVSPTWNNAGTDFTGIYGRVTNTASGASSKLIDVGTVADGSLFSVSKAGALVAASLNTAGGVVGNYAALNGFSVWVGYSTAMVKTTGWTKTLQWADASIDAVPFVAIGPSANNTATLKVSDGSTGYGSIDVLGLKVSGVDGATHSGLVTSITVINGIVTAVT